MTTDFSRRRLFRLLIAFRWLSLLPGLLLLQNTPDGALLIHPAILLSGAVVVNLFVSLSARWLNELLLHRPWILALDIAYSITVLLVSGGGNGPMFLHSLSPLFAAAFFFQVQGGLLASTVFTAIYIGSSFYLGELAEGTTNISLLTSQLAAIWVIPIVMGELSTISRDLVFSNQMATDAQSELTRQNDELTEAHDRLQTIHDLTRLLQAAPDVRTMEAQVLTTLSQSLRYSRALLGLVKPGTDVLFSWKGLHEGQFVAEPELTGTNTPLRLLPEYPLIEEVLRAGQPAIQQPGNEERLHPAIREWAGEDRLLMVPLIFHEQAVGILLLPVHGSQDVLQGESAMLLMTLANQAATSLGTTMLCVERAQDLAVEQERNRIAREIHDTVSQSLFGMVYSLDACIRMLPEKSDLVKNELVELQSLANLTRDQVRHSIFDLWPSSLTLDIFQSDLNHYVSHCFRLVPFEIEYDVSDGFNDLSPAIRRNVYRITQEALTNVLHHAGVDRATVHMDIQARSIDLKISDEGVGFDVENALSREYNREHFGLHGIKERAHAMGGVCRIHSSPGEGATIEVRIPMRNGRSV